MYDIIEGIDVLEADSGPFNKPSVPLIRPAAYACKSRRMVEIFCSSNLATATRAFCCFLPSFTEQLYSFNLESQPQFHS